VAWRIDPADLAWYVIGVLPLVVIQVVVERRRLAR
jgi:hypothetical protein